MTKFIWNTYTRSLVLWILAHLLPIKRRRVICICWGGAKYNCNPRAITDRMLKDGLVDKSKKNSFEVIYAFINPSQFAIEFPKEFLAVEIGGLSYFYYLATANFIISNTRLGGGIFWPFRKKKGQYYIQTMHGGHGLKKVELDAKETLNKQYIDGIYADAKRIDLMISDSAFWTHCARTAFAYPEGEILEVGLPRNDIFFEGEETRNRCRKRVESIIRAQNKTLSKNEKFLIYCPTFRNNGRRDVYGFDVDNVVAALEKRFGGIWYILVSSHPNMRSFYKEIYDFSHPKMIDIGEEELQPMLVAGDAALTDYSSAGFEFALTNNPVFLLCKDAEDYDRGFYLDPKKIPFQYAETDVELIDNIMNFDNYKYKEDFYRFNADVIGMKETGHSSETVMGWMSNKMY